MIQVRFEDYALTKMRRRNITEQEVREALEAPPSQHYFNRKHGRPNAKRKIPISGRTILVSYKRQRDVFVVVNAMEE